MRNSQTRTVIFLLTTTLALSSSAIFAYGQPKSSTNLYAFGPAITPCDNICQIRKDCQLMANTSTLEEYQLWLVQMTENTYYNYEQICADIVHPDAGGLA